ncbi:transcriptional adapter 2-alpha-like [Zootermopsis nevadensis]|uniref:transcriptional adapter 2-alpha-like n=1 Tax=Zootermopsis nevadensis TaxID=136037 RepID=UPI000B8EBDA8|nr:transcriptional adapter 2-alpha-like [Zootermopsis nevadensis]
MAALVSDLVEEEAADLQFPKDWLCVVGQDTTMTSSVCYVCSSILREPFICCADCSIAVEICSSCFAIGAELDPHKNCHQYIVVKSEFPLYEGSTWTANEELELLDALFKCGFGNWNDISHYVHTRSAQECEKHYVTFYIDNPAPELPKFNNDIHTITSEPPFDYRPLETELPPRYLPGSSSYRALGGYNAARGDFDVEYDNYAETTVSQLDVSTFEPDDPYYEIGTALQTAIVSMYNVRLKERERRKRVVRDHGIIAVRKIFSWLHRFETTVTRTIAERLLLFMQLMSGIDFDYIMEGLHHAGKLKQYILRLQGLRENGITRFHSCRLFQKLLRIRESHRKERRLLHSSACWRTVNNSVPSLSPAVKTFPSVMRRPPPPLDIVGLPGYERLSPEERQLCSATRLVPESYLEFQRILVAECKRNSGLKLAEARTLIKIDVNKTRKVYDFLPFCLGFSLLMQKKLHKFELASLANLCPETPEEAKALIPSLEGRFEDEELRQILDDIQTKRSLQY